jgi:hypothetical protein
LFIINRADKLFEELLERIIFWYSKISLAYFLKAYPYGASPLFDKFFIDIPQLNFY